MDQPQPNLQKLNDTITSEQIALLRKKISGWLRQVRYRANTSHAPTDVKLDDIMLLYAESNYKCAYCGGIAGSPDHPFPIKEHGPCVLANIVPCCDGCRSKKKNHNLIKFHRDGHLDKEQFQACVVQMVKRSGGDKLKDYIKTTFPGRD
jgi:5-methylcytosine-specific restriction endonuclease McrA